MARSDKVVVVASDRALSITASNGANKISLEARISLVNRNQ
jgi:hypothetical protein